MHGRAATNCVTLGNGGKWSGGQEGEMVEWRNGNGKGLEGGEGS